MVAYNNACDPISQCLVLMHLGEQFIENTIVCKINKSLVVANIVCAQNKTKKKTLYAPPKKRKKKSFYVPMFLIRPNI